MKGNQVTIVSIILVGSVLQFLMPFLPIWLFPLIISFCVVWMVKQKPILTGFAGGTVFGLVFILVVYFGTLVLPSTSPLIGGKFSEDTIVGLIAYIPISGLLGLLSGTVAKFILKV
jgi:hypothetical protein